MVLCRWWAAPVAASFQAAVPPPGIPPVVEDAMLAGLAQTHGAADVFWGHSWMTNKPTAVLPAPLLSPLPPAVLPAAAALSIPGLSTPPGHPCGLAPDTYSVCGSLCFLLRSLFQANCAATDAGAAISKASSLSCQAGQVTLTWRTGRP